MAYLHHVDIGVGELQLVGQRHLVLLLHRVAEGGGELLQVAVGSIGVEAYQSVEGVERVEEIMRRYLLLHGLVAVQEVLSLESLVLEHDALVLHDSAYEHRDEEGNQSRRHVGDEGDAETVGGLAFAIDECLDAEA